MQPDFIIIGAMRCGTTSLASMLNQHPNIHMAVDQHGEVHYFDRDDRRGDPSWYEATLTANKKKTASIIGEKTPRYCAMPSALLAIREQAPTAKLIMTIREPVDRYLSHMAMGPPADHYDALWRGCYVDQLRLIRELGLSDPLVLFTEDIKQRTQDTLNHVFGVLGVCEFSVTPNHRRSNNATPDVELEPLREFYRTKDRDLFEMLGMPPRW